MLYLVTTSYFWIFDFICLFLLSLQCFLNCFWLEHFFSRSFLRNFFFITIFIGSFFCCLKLIILSQVLSDYSLILNLNILRQNPKHYLYGLSLIGTCFLLLGYIIITISTVMLSDRILNFKLNNLFFASSFLVCTHILTQTTNFIYMYIAFEMLFFPSLYYAYTLSYTKEADRPIYLLGLWMVGGSFLVLGALSYLYFSYSISSIEQAIQIQLSVYEAYSLGICFFIGFGTKIPVFPLYFWLTKVHVEAPAGFSIFLSGFLVKTALYCFMIFFQSLNLNVLQPFIFFILCVGSLSTALKMFGELDLKKLIAFCTIQEMNILFFLWLSLGLSHFRFIPLFLFMHGLLTSLMFYTIEIIQRNANTRFKPGLAGLSHQSFFLNWLIWAMLLLFCGFPLTLKFIVEVTLIITLFTLYSKLGLVLFLSIYIFTNTAMCYCWLSILSGTASQELQKQSWLITLQDKFICSFLISFLVILPFFL